MKINANFAKTLSFSVLMENVQETPKINFVIDTEKIKVSFPCVVLEDSTVQVEIPPLSEYRNVFTEKEYPGYLEAIIGESYKIPWECTVEIIAPVQISVQSPEETSSPTKTRIKIQDIKETEQPKPPEDRILKDEEQPKKPEKKRNIFKEFITQ